MEKVNFEQAKKEVIKWLEFKKIDSDKIEENSESVDTLATAISKGNVVLDKDYNMTQELKFPLMDDDGNPTLTQLKFKPRLKMGEIQTRTQNINSKDLFALVTAYICALTNTNSGIIKEMDSEDYKTAQAIVIFFL